MRRRLATGGSAIDRSQAVRFRFDGAEYEGFAGDTLASALLANGVRGGFRSPILGRPRGVMTAGWRSRTRSSRSPSPGSTRSWRQRRSRSSTVSWREPARAGACSRPRATPARPSTAPCTSRLLVVGGGHDGPLAAAEAAARRGDRVLLVDEPPPRGHAPRGAEGARPDERDGARRLRRRVRASSTSGRRAIASGTRAGKGRPRDRRHRATDRVRRERPARRDARLRRCRVPRRFGVARHDAHRASPTNGARSTSPSRPLARSRVVDVHGGRDGLHAPEPDGERQSFVVSGGWNPNLALWRAIGGRSVRRRSRMLRPDGGPAVAAVVGHGGGDGLRRAYPVGSSRTTLTPLRRSPARPDRRRRRSTPSAPACAS